MRWPNSSMRSSAVSWSIVSVMVTGVPILNRALTRSAPRSAIRLASSWTVIASGTITSRTCLADGPDCWWALFSFSRERRSAARLRAPAVVLAGKGAGDGELAGVAAVVAAAGRTGRRLGRRRMALGPGMGRAAVVVLLFGGGRRSRLRRRARARPHGAPLPRRRGGPARSVPPRRGDSPRRGAFRPRSPAGPACPRGGALPRARSGGLPRPRGEACPEARGGWRRRPGAASAPDAGGAGGAATGAAGFGASGTGAGAASWADWGPRIRRFFTSTTTVFERPWLKLCLTLPVSTVRFRPSGARAPSFGLSDVSLITFLRSHSQPTRPAGPPRRRLAQLQIR